MENKYYTPEIEEFHVGFGYEVEDLGDDGKSRVWRHQVFDGEETRTYFIEELRKKEMRVKYLDREDIESLGWTLNNAENRESFILVIKGIKYILTYNNYLGSRVLSIEWIFRGREPRPRFLGNIKNKSELRKLMKQLGIC